MKNKKSSQLLLSIFCLALVAGCSGGGASAGSSSDGGSGGAGDVPGVKTANGVSVVTPTE
jgi:hypothetical protein